MINHTGLTSVQEAMLMCSIARAHIESVDKTLAKSKYHAYEILGYGKRFGSPVERRMWFSITKQVRKRTKMKLPKVIYVGRCRRTGWFHCLENHPVKPGWSKSQWLLYSSWGTVNWR